MARLIRPVMAIRCTQSGCRALFEVAEVEEGKQQEVVCPNCGEHYVYPILDKEEDNK
jgi:DNA-directed RNA polymerase subunit RPC12/RpoP